jgi:leucyl aminopeptidase
MKTKEIKYMSLTHENPLKEAIERSVNYCKYLSDLPSNVCTPTFLYKEFHNLSKRYTNVQNRSLSGTRQLNGRSLKLITAVNAGTHRTPYLAQLNYIGDPNSTKVDVALVGKGITYDSGGYSLKDSESMSSMKYDMAGAAAVLAAFRGAVELDLKLNIAVVAPICENMVSSRAVRPGDIVETIGRNKVEIVDTDAEGRLILADALYHTALYENPNVMIDVATLTGTAESFYGEDLSVLLTDSIELQNKLSLASSMTGDLAVPAPLYAPYAELLKGTDGLSDIKNLSPDNAAGTITAALFLKHFIEGSSYTGEWAHLDVAGTATKFEDGNYRATGRPVPLLLEYLYRESRVI